MIRSGHTRYGLLGAVSLVALAAANGAAFAQTTGAGDPAAGAPAGQSVQASNAPNTLPEIIVQARRRSENVQTVPIDVDVVSQQQISRDNVTKASDLVQIAPALQENATTDPNNIDFAIRGQTQTYGTLAPAVVTYFAQVPLPFISQGLFYDLDNIQVLKGPQGTLFGVVTDGGDILLQPTRPSNSFGGYLDVSGGDYGLVHVQGAVDLPLVDDKVLVRLATNIERRDGYTLNTFNGGALDGVNTDSFRFSMIVRPVEHLENYTVVEYDQANEYGAAGVLLGYNPRSVANIPAWQNALNFQQSHGPFVVNEGVPNWYRNGMYNLLNTVTVSNTTSYEFSKALTIKNIFGFTNYWDSYGDASPGGVPGIGNLGLGAQYPIYYNYRQLVSDEVQAQGELFGDRLNYTLGFFTDRENTPGPADQYAIVSEGPLIIQASVVDYPTTQSNAGYGQVTYDFKDVIPPGWGSLKLDLGGRYSVDSVTANNAEYLTVGTTVTHGGLPLNGACLSASQVAALYPTAITNTPCTHGSASFNAATYLVGLDYTIRNTYMYLKLEEGYRPGGFNATSGGIIQPSYGAEFSSSHEAGIKSDWSVGSVKAQTNLVFFYDRITNTQEYVSTLSNGALSTGVVGGLPQNVEGVEFQGKVIPVEHLELGVDWAWTKGEFDTAHVPAAKIAASCPANPYTTPVAENGLVCPIGGIDLLPRNVVDLTARYSIPLGEPGTVSFGGDAYITSSENCSPCNTEKLPPIPTAPLGSTIPGYSVVNLEIDWDKPFEKPVTLRAFVTNVADTKYLQGETNYLAAGSLGASEGFYGAPRMWGLGLKWDF